MVIKLGISNTLLRQSSKFHNGSVALNKDGVIYVCGFPYSESTLIQWNTLFEERTKRYQPILPFFVCTAWRRETVYLQLVIARTDDTLELISKNCKC